MDFERMKDECPWMFIDLTPGDVQSEQCTACNGPCTEDNCAPYHWIKELVGSLWVTAKATIRTD